MFLRVETGYKAEFSDPEAKKTQQKLTSINPTLGEKVRWARKLKVYWIELDAPRDKVVQAVQIAFRNPVTHWIFTGDLLPSAAGSSGTLYDLMQESPFRPGIFHGIEKRKRLQVHDEEAFVITDALQMILGRKVPQDKVVSGELLLIEGARLVQNDLEWIARHWFAQEKFESWSLLSEDELKRNSRFQSEQVGKYLISPQNQSKSRLLQFRQASRTPNEGYRWGDLKEKFLIQVETPEKCMHLLEEEWEIRPEVRFGSMNLLQDTHTELEFGLIRQQLEAFSFHARSQLQTVLSVLPDDKNRLWIGDVHGLHPTRVRDDFETSLKRVAETTGTPIVQMKCFEEMHENEPAFFWSSSVAVKQTGAKKPPAKGSIVDLFWVGFYNPPAMTNLTHVELMKSALVQAEAGNAVDFAISTTGRSLLETLKNSKNEFKYGFDIVADGAQEWFTSFLEAPMPLGMIWGVHPDKKEWVMDELRSRNLPSLHFGSTSLTGEIRVLEGGQVRALVNVGEFFKYKTTPIKEKLVDDPLYVQENRAQPTKLKNRFSVEELLLKPETYHVSVPSPVVIRPRLTSWSGLMVLSDLCGVEFNNVYLEYLMRKCTALGGQIHSAQVSMLNGLKQWSKTLDQMQDHLGIQISQLEVKVDTKIRSHWLALQLVARVSDVRSVRSEDFKYAQDRIYWLAGGLDQPSTHWLAGVEGRYQSGLHSAVAIEAEGGAQGVINTLLYALLKRKLGAEVKITDAFAGGFFVSVSENERFAVEEEWRAIGVEFQFVGRVSATPFLVVRDQNDRVHTIGVEDMG